MFNTNTGYRSCSEGEKGDDNAVIPGSLDKEGYFFLAVFFAVFFAVFLVFVPHGALDLQAIPHLLIRFSITLSQGLDAVNGILELLACSGL